MSQLKQLKERMNTMLSISKVTKVMQVISIVKSTKAKDSLRKSNQFKSNVDRSFYDILPSFLNSDYQNCFSKLLKPNSNTQHVSIIAISSSKGMCGSINNDVGKKVVEYVKNNNDKKIEIFCYGDKVYNFCTSRLKLLDNINIVLMENFNENEIKYGICGNFIDSLMQKYINDETSELVCFSPNLKSAISQDVVQTVLLPIQYKRSDNNESFFQYSYEDSKAAMFSKIFSDFYHLIINSSAATNTSRMISMDNATKNSNQKFKELSLQYNNKRQSKITSELIDIISGANSI